MQISLVKKKDPNCYEGDNTIQSITTSRFEKTNQKSKTRLSSNKNDSLGSTVKSREFIDEDSDENMDSN